MGEMFDKREYLTHPRGSPETARKESHRGEREGNPASTPLEVVSKRGRGLAVGGRTVLRGCPSSRGLGG